MTVSGIQPDLRPAPRSCRHPGARGHETHNLPFPESSFGPHVVSLEVHPAGGFLS